MFEKTGRSVKEKFSRFHYVLGYMGRLFSASAFFFPQEKTARKILIMQLLFTCVEALPLIMLISLALGSAIYLIGYNFLLSINNTALIHRLLILIITQELGPVLVAFIVTARSATAIATELGNMVISHQIESYVSVGVDPVSHLAAPRFLGVTMSVFILNVYFSVCGLLGPRIVCFFINPLAASGYFHELFQAFSLSSIFISCLKSIIFGMIISIAATYYGFSVEHASTEVPIAGIKSVGKSFAFIIVVDVAFVILGNIH